MMNQKRQSDLPAYFTRDLLAAIRYVKLEKGEHLFRTGDRVNGIYFILGGEVKAVRPMHNESDAVMMRAGVGEFFAESAIAASHYTCDAMAVRPSQVAFLSQASLESALADAAFAKAFFLANAKNARIQCSRYERVRLRSAKDRVLHLLACEAGPDGTFHWPAALTELATELALEPETLYRVLAELEKAGKITRNKRTFQIVS